MLAVTKVMHELVRMHEGRHWVMPAEESRDAKGKVAVVQLGCEVTEGEGSLGSIYCCCCLISVVSQL